MSESQSRPAARGRSSARGGRGGHGSRGPRSNKQSNGDSAASGPIDTSADSGELGELKKRYQSQLSTLKELFSDWTDADLVLAIEDSNGDLESTIERITEGNVSQFAEVKKPKDRARSKVKDATTPAPEGTPRGGRGRGGDSVRGGRGRGTERGRGGYRGGRGGATTNGARPSGVPSVPTGDSTVWEAANVSSDAKENGDVHAAAQPVATQVKEPEAPKAAAPAKKTWASMFAAPKLAPAPPKPAVQPPTAHEQAPLTHTEPSAPEAIPDPIVEAEDLPIPPVADEILDEPSIPIEERAPTPEKSVEEETINLTPSKDELTQENVEHIPDTDHGRPATETVASTVASGRDIGVATPLNTVAQVPIGRPGLGGYATTAMKATGAGHRSASFQRKLQEQQEAVVMPGNHAVDRAAVQFGSLGLNGDLDADSLDVDEDREEAETRTQPPQHSPVAQPRASLPPAPRQAAPLIDAQPQESIPTPKQAPGLPPVPQQQPSSVHSPSNPLAAQAMQDQGSQGSQPYNQFGRYGQGGIQSETPAQQKPYDAFGGQGPQGSQHEYPGQQQQQQQQQSQSLPYSQAGGFSSAPDAFASQYLTSDQHRSAYQSYYQQYNQQGTPSQQEAGSAQQRSGSAFGTGPSDSAFPPSQQQQQSHGRYNETSNSGHTTPNPALGTQHPTGPGSQGHVHHQHAQQGQSGGGYPFSQHPYYSNPAYAGYMNQYGNYGQGGYGSFGGKGMYQQQHPYYGMNQQGSFDQHSSSPANAGGFGGSHGRDSGLGGGLGDYGRTVSGASQNQHAATAGGFGGFPESFGRSQSGYPNQNSYGQQQSGQQGNEDSLKPFGDSKSGGPSPSALGAQPGRPGSATNNTAGQSTQGLPPQQQGGFGGGYPSHMGGQGNQYGGLGGLGHQGAGSHQGGGYGSYGGFGGGYNNYNRGGGGWGNTYGQH